VQLAVLEKGLQDVKNKMDQLTQAGQQNSSEFEALNKQYGLLEVAYFSTGEGFCFTQQEIRTNERQLQTLSSQGLENTEVFKQLRGEVTKAAQSFKDFQRQEQLLETEAPTLEGLVLAARGLGGAYAVGAGAAALFGGENEKA
jgi:gas vesicle protein